MIWSRQVPGLTSRSDFDDGERASCTPSCISECSPEEADRVGFGSYRHEKMITFGDRLRRIEHLGAGLTR